METEERATKRAYFKKWREENPDKVLNHQLKFWKKKVREMEAAGQ